MSAREPTRDRWWRRPRPPVTGFLAVEGWSTGYVTGRFIAFFGLTVAGLWGLGALQLGWPWWGRAIAVGVSVSAFSGIVVLAAYLHRPVSEELRYDVAEAWARQLAHTGEVDVGVSGVRSVLTIAFLVAFVLLGLVIVVVGSTVLVKLVGVATAVVLFLLGLLPHVEFATGRGPGLHVDSRGITIARWVPLHIPWSEVAGAHTHQRLVVVVDTQDRFAAGYQASRPLLLRLTGGGPGLFFDRGFAIAGTIRANPDALATWLSYEAAQRRSTT